MATKAQSHSLEARMSSQRLVSDRASPIVVRRQTLELSNQVAYSQGRNQSRPLEESRLIAIALFPRSLKRFDCQIQHILRLPAQSQLQKPQKPRNKHFEGDCTLIVGAFLAVSPSSREGQPRCFLSFFSRSERKGRDEEQGRKRGDGQVVWVREERINICRSTAPPCCATRDKLCGVTGNREEIYGNYSRSFGFFRTETQSLQNGRKVCEIHHEFQQCGVLSWQLTKHFVKKLR